jgi:hypothetical protein
MRAKKSSPFLIKSATSSMREKRRTFRTGEPILESGIYRVIHKSHRLPHEVTLLQRQIFPRCAKCQDEVQFELIRVATELLRDHGFRVFLYELPAEDGTSISAKAV